MAQFQVSKRMMFGSDIKGLTREGKRDLIKSRIKSALMASPQLSSPNTTDAFATSESFTDTNANGSTVDTVLCRRCFEFAYMIPGSTFDECLLSVLDQDPVLSAKFTHLRAGQTSPGGSVKGTESTTGSTSSGGTGGQQWSGGASGSPSFGYGSVDKRDPAAAAKSAENAPSSSGGLLSALFGGGTQSKSSSSSNVPTIVSGAPTVPPAPPSNESTPLLAPPGLEENYSKAFVDFILYGPPPPPPKGAPKVPWKWWHAWDVAANTREIFIRDREGDLAFLDGIRAIAYFWVLGDHMYQAFNSEMTGFNTWWEALGTSGNEFQILSNGNKGDQGVTSFFVLSGFLIPFIFSRMINAANKESEAIGQPAPEFGFHAFEFLFRRYMRLAPTLYSGTLVAYLYGNAMKDISSSADATFYESCREYWWENIFFINNFSGLAGWQDCYDSVWTISVEYQLYILTIPVVYCFCWKEIYGWFAAVIWTVVTVIIRVAVTDWCDATGAAYGAYVYLPSWTRAPEYGVGMLSFMLYDHYYGNPKKRAAIKPIGDLNGSELVLRVMFHALIFGSLIFGLYYVAAGDEWWTLSYQQYESFSYLLWGLTLFAVAHITFENIIWPVKWILSWYGWYPVAQLAYTGGVLNMVICHGMASLVMEVSGFQTWSTDTSLASYFMLYVSVGLLSLIFGLVLSLLVERPFMNLAKKVAPFWKLFGPDKKGEMPLTASVTAASTGQGREAQI